MYMVMAIKKSIEGNIMGIPTHINLMWAEGMVGALPVFDTKKQAEEYCNGNKVSIIEVGELNESPNYQKR